MIQCTNSHENDLPSNYHPPSPTQTPHRTSKLRKKLQKSSEGWLNRVNGDANTHPNEERGAHEGSADPEARASSCVLEVAPHASHHMLAAAFPLPLEMHKPLSNGIKAWEWKCLHFQKPVKYISTFFLFFTLSCDGFSEKFRKSCWKSASKMAVDVIVVASMSFSIHRSSVKSLLTALFH